MFDDYKFDLQLFAEDDAEDTQAEDKEPIPEELEGISEDVARETMAEAKRQAEEAESQEDEEPSPVEAESDAKNQNDSVLDVPKAKVPYERFKQKVDETNSLKQQNEELMAKLKSYEANKASQPTEPAPQEQPTEQEQAKPPIQFTPEIAEKINEAIKEQALALSGLTQEDVDALEYADDDDPRQMQWQTAKTFARNTVMANVQRAYQQQADTRMKFLQLHQAAVEDFNKFAQAQMKEPDFEAVKTYATNDYFNGLDEATQATIAGAYSRIERNVASPAEILLVKDYFNKAKAAYKRGGKSSRSNLNATENKLRQADKLPRASQVSGTVSPTDGTISVEALEDMVQNKPWDEIPKQYRDMLLGG